MKLYGYWRSSATWRVRIALNFKEIPYEYIPVHLVNDGGEHRQDWYQALNPSQQVPTLEVELDGSTRHLGQSLAIMEFLEDFKADPAMIPSDLYLRARTRQLAEIVNSGIQPLQNMSVLNHLKALKIDPNAWSRKWISQGLTAYQTVVETTAGTFSVGDSPTWADACLIPQLYNARRFSIDLAPYSRLVDIEAACIELDSFKRAHADAQPDAQP